VTQGGRTHRDLALQEQDEEEEQTYSNPLRLKSRGGQIASSVAKLDTGAEIVLTRTAAVGAVAAATGPKTALTASEPRGGATSRRRVAIGR
jgi:hypothetical protein